MTKLRGATILAIALGLLLITIPPAFGDSGWNPVVPGVDLQEFRLAGPIRVHVTRMDRNNPTLTLETMLPWGTLSGERQTVSEMVAHYDQTLSAWNGSWGDRNRVVAAINGSYFDLGTGEPNNGMVMGGWYTKMYSDLGGWSGFIWRQDRAAYVGACVTHPAGSMSLTNLINGTHMPIDGVNSEINADQLVVYTPHYDAFSPGQRNGAEVLIGLYQPLGLNTTIGTVLSVHSGEGPLPIPFDAAVLSARGSAAAALLNTHKPGDVISIDLQLTHFEADCRSSAPFSWAGTYTSLGGTLPFLREGEIIPFQDDGAEQKHPRTAICFNEDWLYFVVVDGRNNGYSIGMTIPELASFCKDRLSATWGVNQDGGGSSTLWADGQVANRPSSGDERRVANGIMIVALEPMQNSLSFRPGDRVNTSYATNLHLGPGTNYPAITSVGADSLGYIQPHLAGLAGVRAKGTFWWKVNFAGLVGWVDEASLELVETNLPLYSSLAPMSWMNPTP